MPRALSFKDWGVRAMLNVVPDSWPPKAIDPSKPMKHCTRRVMNPQPTFIKELTGPGPKDCSLHWQWKNHNLGEPGAEERLLAESPYGAPGFVGYAKEALVWRELEQAPYYDDGEGHVAYKADNAYVHDRNFFDMNRLWDWQRDTLPAMFMPEWAGRLWYEVMRVRVERVQDISYADCIAEGCGPDRETIHADEVFAYKWDEINAGRKATSASRRTATSEPGPFSWDDNPWVWVVDYKIISVGHK